MSGISRFLLVCILSLVSLRAPAAERSLESRINQIISAPEFKTAHWGILISDREWGTVHYELNADKLFAPASVTKLFTVATALDAFGADHQFETPVYQNGSVNSSGVLDGDLILVATGDLTMGGRTDSEGRIAFTNSDHTYANGGTDGALSAPDPLAGLNSLARQVADAGIKHVRGDIWVDDRLFDRAEGSGSGPARVTPILINDNLIDITLTPRRAGQMAKVDWRPRTRTIQIDASVETSAHGQPVEVRLTSIAPGRLLVRGRIPEGHKPLLRVHEVEDAASFARALFIEALRRAGVRVSASLFASNNSAVLPSSDRYAGLKRVAALKSPPFEENAKLILKVSHNLHASTLPLLVAAKHGKRTLADGLRMQHAFLATTGLDVESISFGGGAGGSRADYTTPRATVHLLRHMAKRDDAAAYERALPILGIDGTLASAVDAESPARGKVRAKTGTLFWHNPMNGGYLLTSKALAGYITTARGRELAFAFFVNNVNLSGGRGTAAIGRTLGKLCETVYED